MECDEQPKSMMERSLEIRTANYLFYMNNSAHLNVEFDNCCNDLSKETQVKAEIPQNKMYEEYDHLGREILRKCSKGR